MNPDNELNMRTNITQRVMASISAFALAVSQLALPARAEASPGASTASAGSIPPPSVTAIQSFQPDLFTGRASTSVPIALPPGRKGMQPSLSLSYSSSSRNGWLGVGWSLDLGYIERSTKNGVPRYDASDTYSFTFQGISSDLVQIADGTYRAKDEGLFMRFESLGYSGWQVRDKSGIRYFFGQDASSQIVDAGHCFRWALDKIIDTNGNTITITYSKDQNQIYPASIQYTGHETVSVVAENKVDFTLETRPDSEISYRSGFPVTTAKRLKEISNFSQGRLARRYALNYATSPQTNRSLLFSVTQIGTDASTSLPTTQFAYQDSGTTSYSVSSNNPSLSVAAWNVRKASADQGHDNYGCENPYRGFSWTAPVVVTGSTDLGCVSADASGNGSVTMRGCQDHYGHAFTWVYASSSRMISLPLATGSDTEFCMWLEGGGSLQRMTSSSVPLSAGWSLIHLVAYHQHAGWGPAWINTSLIDKVDIMSPSQFIMPQLTGDVDGNGTSDLITYDSQANSWLVARGGASGFSPKENWLSGFWDASSIPALGDFDADGLTDLAIYSSGSFRFARSNSSGFQANYWPQYSLGSGVPLVGDFNGDGKTDLGSYNNGSWSFAIANGSGSFISFGNLSWGDSNYEPLMGDFNGDGLTDIGLVSKSSGAIEVRLSTGSGWADATNWIGSFGGNNPHISADINGDGATDAVYYNRSSGEVIYAPANGSGFGSAVSLPVSFGLRSNDDNLQIGDFNGDSLADPAVFNPISGRSEVASSQGKLPDLLRELQNGIGGATNLVYQNSSQLNNTLLPFVIPVVQQVKTSDGMGNEYTTTYSYAGGFYDSPTREFRGFSKAEVRDPQANTTVTDFHQDAHKKGRPYKVEFRDSFGKLWTRSEQTWDCTHPFNDVHFVQLDQTDSYIYDGNESSRHAQTNFTYDSYGNLTKSEEKGDVSISGDERTAQTAYTLNETDWILNKPSLAQTLDANGNVVSQRRFYYDGATGNLTKEEEWLTDPTRQLANPPTETWLPTLLSYDQYGNVKTVTDALGRATTNEYDASDTYLVKITNVLGHTRTLTYDPRLGAVTSSTDQNGVTTTTEYDALGRVTKVIGPTDTPSLPTIEYEYDLSSVPSKTITHSRIQSGSTLHMTHYTFNDGIGRTIQTRSPAEDPTKQIVSGNVEYDPRGFVIKQYLPYLESAYSSYVPPGAVTPNSEFRTPNYTYDPLGRLLTTTDPDGSVTSAEYDDWTITTTDASGNKTRRTSDAYGRLIKVEELNGSDIYTTTYKYDALNNLITVIDALNNITAISYDSLGRKISMDDPDMGAWAYEYDAVDNLISQTDARGVVTNFTYDALNRLTRKEYDDNVLATGPLGHLATVTYTYDDATNPFSKGKLTGITDGSGSSSFDYDNLGRLIKEEKVIDGTRYTVHRSYDLLGRLTSLTYPDGDIASYTYNAQGGIETVELERANAPTRQPIVTDVAYNSASQMTKISYGNGVTTDYSYDPQTLRLSSLRTQNSALRTLQDFSYQFDAVGNVTQITDAVNAGAQSFEYDPLNRLTRAVGSYGDFRYAYDPIGNMTEKEDVTMRYGENGAGPHAVTSALSTKHQALSMSYDANGNLLAKTTDYGPQTTDLTAQQFSYDAENRLMEVKTAQDETVSVTFKPGWNFFSLPVIPDDGAVVVLLPSFAQDFEQIAKFEPATGKFKHHVGNPKFDDFDSLEYGVGYQIYAKQEVTIEFKGKLPTQKLSESLEAGWHLLPALSTKQQALSSTFAGLDYDQLLAYDSTTQTLKPASQIEAAQAYWVHLRIAGAFSPSLPRDPTTKSIYDGDGGKVKQITPSGTTTYLGELFEKDSSGNSTKHIFAGSQRICAVVSGLSSVDYHYYHGDHLGSSNVITDEIGSVIEHTEHTPYGAIHRSERANPQTRQPANPSIGFTGQRQDSTNGLVLFPARAYDPQLGRFLQPDPHVQDPSDPQTLNRYSYVRNNPVNLVDPSGNLWFIAALIVAAVKAAIAGAITGAVISASVAAIRGEDIGKAAWRGARSGAASGALLGAGGFAIGAQGVALAGTAKTLAEVGIAAASGAVGGGVDSRIQGGSFSGGLLPGAIGGVLGYGASRAIGAVVNRLGLPTPEPGAPGQQLGLMQSFRQWLSKAGSVAAGSSDDAFQTMLRRVEILDFSTGSNQAVFYSGAGQKLRAEAFASATGRLTIGMTPGGKQLMSDPLFQSLSADQQYLIWQKASAPFARGASGTINAFIKGAKPTGTFRTIEEPILDESPSVYGRRYWY